LRCRQEELLSQHEKLLQIKSVALHCHPRSTHDSFEKIQCKLNPVQFIQHMVVCSLLAFKPSSPCKPGCGNQCTVQSQQGSTGNVKGVQVSCGYNLQRTIIV
ncbi:hypothetical protein XENOCAPTIV_013812, partial [Xenoophorus captivus]